MCRHEENLLCLRHDVSQPLGGLDYFPSQEVCYASWVGLVLRGCWISTNSWKPVLKPSASAQPKGGRWARLGSWVLMRHTG